MIKLKDKNIGLAKILCFNLEKHIHMNRIKQKKNLRLRNKILQFDFSFCFDHVVINSILANFFQLLIFLIFIFKGYWNSIDGLLNQQKQVKKRHNNQILFSRIKFNKCNGRFIDTDNKRIPTFHPI